MERVAGFPLPSLYALRSWHGTAACVAASRRLSPGGAGADLLLFAPLLAFFPYGTLAGQLGLLILVRPARCPLCVVPLCWLSSCLPSAYTRLPRIPTWLSFPLLLPAQLPALDLSPCIRRFMFFPAGSLFFRCCNFLFCLAALCTTLLEPYHCTSIPTLALKPARPVFPVAPSPLPRFPLYMFVCSLSFSHMAFALSPLWLLPGLGLYMVRLCRLKLQPDARHFSPPFSLSSPPASLVF